MVRIITDSLCDLTMEDAQKMNIDIMPLYVRFGKDEYRCGVDLSNEEFYSKLEASSEAPTTAAVNPYEFEEIFQRYLEAGDDVVAILFSRYMSTTYQSATIAAENFETEHLHLIDCENGAMGQALLIATAVAIRDSGATAQQLCDRIRNLLPRTMTYMIVDNMDYLHQGGRISASADEVNETVRIHPVLRLLPDGVKPLDKVRGRKSSNAWLVNRLKEYPADTDYKLVIGHSNAIERAETLRDQIRAAGIENEILITCIAPIVGTHIGPNSIGIGYILAE